MDEVPSCVGVTSPDCPLSTGPLQLIVAEQYRGVVKYTKIISNRQHSGMFSCTIKGDKNTRQTGHIVSYHFV